MIATQTRHICAQIRQKWRVWAFLTSQTGISTRRVARSTQIAF